MAGDDDRSRLKLSTLYTSSASPWEFLVPASSSMPSSSPETQPAAVNYVLGFLMVGLAWGFTTPFIRRAARDHNPLPRPILERRDVQESWLKSRVYSAFFAVVDLLRNPRYAVPLLINLTGSVWFFLLIGQAGELMPQYCAAPCPTFRGTDTVISQN